MNREQNVVEVTHNRMAGPSYTNVGKLTSLTDVAGITQSTTESNDGWGNTYYETNT